MLFERWVRQFAKDGIERLADLRRMAMNGSEQNRRLLIRIDDLDARTLEVLAKQGPADVRLKVANHPNLHEELARALLDHPRILDAAFKTVLRERIGAWELEEEPGEAESAIEAATANASNEAATSWPAVETATLAPTHPTTDDRVHTIPTDPDRSNPLASPASATTPSVNRDVFEEPTSPATPTWTEFVATRAYVEAEIHFEPEPPPDAEAGFAFEEDAGEALDRALRLSPAEPKTLPTTVLDPSQLDLLDALAFADDEDEAEAIEIAEVPSAPDLDERVEAVLYAIFDQHVDGISPGPALDALRDKIAAKRPGGLIRSLRNLISEGADPEAIVLAYAARSYWQETHVDNGKRYTYLDWRTAVGLMQSFNGYPDLDEAIQVLEKLDHRWRATGCTYSLSMFLKGSIEDLTTYRASGGTLPADLFFP